MTTTAKQGATMAEKIKIDNKPIDEGMKEAGEKAHVGQDPDDADGFSFGAGADLEAAATQDGEAALTLDKDPLPPGSSGSELQDFREVSGNGAGDPAFGSGADGELARERPTAPPGYDPAELDGDSAVEHGVSIPPEGFDHLETVGQADDLDADIA